MGSRYLIFQPIPSSLDQDKMDDQRSNSICFLIELLVVDRHPSVSLWKCGGEHGGRHVLFFVCLDIGSLLSSLWCVVSMFLLEYNNYPNSYDAQLAITRVLKFLLLIVFLVCL